MRNVLLTGGTRGLGLEIAGDLAARGYHVIATGREISPALEELGRNPSGEGGVEFMKLDLAADDLHGFISEVTGRHGNLYGLVNNAALGIDGVLATMHDSEIEEILDVNVRATIVLTKYAVRSMLLENEGRIVNVSSIIAHTGYKGLSVYAASKAALIGFTRSLARELGSAGITVNAVAPGFMETDMTGEIDEERMASIIRRSPLKRLVTTTDVAGGVAWLLGPEAAGITGTTLTIDAGSTA
jgi:3-oxoacyl-[acyl-carrier protein] reductase